MARPFFLLLAALGAVVLCRLGPARAGERGSLEPRMDFLDNGIIRVGVDLKIGGAITYLSESPATGREQNVINSWDWGRQVQLSYYSGPVPYVEGDKRPKKEWAGLGWNPIQAGDCFGHGSRTIEHTNDGKTLHIKCIPMQWPMDGVPGECTFETWLTLEGPVVHSRSRVNNNRSDMTQYPGRMQELPAIYTNGPFYRLMTYSGEKPFSGDVLTQIKHQLGDEGKPWAHWYATERWAALVNDADWGLGVFNPSCGEMSGGFAGKTGAGGPHDNPTGYIAPNSIEILDWNIVHEFKYDLILGTLGDIRKYVYATMPRPAVPAWHFDSDRQGWHYVDATDSGWPIKGELNIRLGQKNPQLVGPVSFWQADQAPVLTINAALHANQTHARIFWRTIADPAFTSAKSIAIELKPDGDYHVYIVRLDQSPRYAGGIVQFRVDPVAYGEAGDWIRIKSIECGGSNAH